GGIYQSMSYGDDEQTGAILGYEQPLSGKVSFVADWFSGKNFWGYFTPGISIVLPHSGLLNIGYALGNDSYDSANSDYKNRAFFIYYGITFPSTAGHTAGASDGRSPGPRGYCGNANAM